MKFEAAWLHEPLFEVPDIQAAVCLFVWNIPENALVPLGVPPGGSSLPPPDATETALPRLVFAAAWLHERLFVPPDIQAAVCLFSWAMTDAALVCATAALDVVARTRSPDAIIDATIGNNFVVLMF